RLDAFEWRDPLAGEDHAMIEAGERTMLEVSRARAPAEEAHGEPQARSAPSPTESGLARAPHEAVQVGQARLATGWGVGSSREPHAAIPSPTSGPSPQGDGKHAESATPPPQESPPQESARRRGRGATPVPLAPAVIPLIHAPDDPGPEPEAEIEP